MNGQWLGTYSGTNSGLAVLELDDMGSHLEGAVFAYPDDANLPGVAGNLMEVPKKTKFSLRVPIEPLDNITAEIVKWDDIKGRYNDLQFASSIESEWECSPDKLSITWKTELGTGNAVLFPSAACDASKLVARADVSTWEEFRRYASELKPYSFMFRGQENSQWRLRTSYHRTGRAYLLKFMGQDIGTLHRYLIAASGHNFNLGDPLQNAAFYSLVQHHGYPTPLLDWTNSPYAAAYFAFKGVRRNQITVGKKVRVFVFDRESWRRDFNQVAKLAPAKPHFSILEPLPIGNPRMVPQQALASVTNVDDIESYIRFREQERQKSYLTAIDLPMEQRREVMQDLSLMGITAGSLFPGLDGVCEQLRERFFDL